MLKWNIFCE